ncbi:2-keto-4-pentenoate hydratase [Methylocella tundrae]|uniref:2-keto-4-pentenoate hydratase n=1 Tax=Methylocella tundrae TaxID=227605 RepID=A0A8B6M7Z1_METTU|nr:fumarylacetoacetate hydrolase family protein [Methylocella tundrae]VTZ27597.1 2-keto-4-pentenoate hydratase [Methylocella tundrae]VTZ51153.1 2-keto-4-pentenoate hydratase [Methylocella tundrae]
MVSYEDAAARLRDAYFKGPVPPLRDVLAPTDAAAYEIQAINTRAWLTKGRRIVGRKVGLTSKAVQAQLGVDQPDYGVLFDDMAIASGGRLSAALIQPKAEAEVALVLERDLSNRDATPEDVAAATAYAVAAIEIVDSRIADWKITFADTVADNGSSAFFVLGDEKKKLAGLDLYTCGMALEVNGALVSLGAGAACLGHPLIAAAWLARTFAALGEGLKAGDIVLTGALGPMVPIHPADFVEAKIGGLGSVSFTYQDGKA